MQTLTILDWDDTLFPTHWVVKNSLNLKDPRIRMKFSYLFTQLDQKIHHLLAQLQSHGEVCIITNATPGWVITCLEILPKTQELVLEDIHVISARKLYQDKFRHVPTWKKKAFEDKYRLCYPDCEDEPSVPKPKASQIQNIISIGDAEYEHQALVNLYTSDGYIPKQKILKSIRFMSSPNLEQVVDQLEVLSKCAHRICQTKKHMELHFQSKK